MKIFCLIACFLFTCFITAKGEGQGVVSNGIPPAGKDSHNTSFHSNPGPTRKLVLIFHHMIGNKTLLLGETFTTATGDTIQVYKFKYYLSNFSVTDDKGKIIQLPPQYCLVDEADSASKTIVLNIPDITVTGVSWLLGVDSIKNVSGIQSGALDPLKGMFWTWNSGYVMAKLEGSATASKIAGQSFQYHIGGFRTPMNTLRTIRLSASLEKDVPAIHIIADINRWFTGKTNLSIAETPVCHGPGPLAVRIADNYSTMFSIQNTY